LRATSTSDQRIAAFDAGLIAAVSTEPTASSALGYSCNYESWSYPTSSMLYLGFQCQSEFCADPVLRRAISLYMDRTSLTSQVFSEYADPSPLPVSPASDLYDDALAAQLGYFPDSAAYFLSNGGYRLGEDGLLRSPKGKPVNLKLVVNIDNSYRLDIARQLAEDLKALGLNVTVSALPWEEFMRALTAGEFDLYLGQTRMTADFDLSPLLTGALNYGLYEDPEALALLELCRSSAGVRRVTSAHTLYRHLADTVPFIPLCFQRAALLTQWGVVSGANPTQLNPLHQFYQWELH
jgi:peptide/nickel transport system substrate-binding protein